MTFGKAPLLPFLLLSPLAHTPSLSRPNSALTDVTEFGINLLPHYLLSHKNVLSRFIKHFEFHLNSIKRNFIRLLYSHILAVLCQSDKPLLS